MAGGSQGLPAAASPVPPAHRGCCRSGDLQRAAHASSVSWRKEGERAGFEGRERRGSRLQLPMAMPRCRGEAGRGSDPGGTPVGCRHRGLRQHPAGRRGSVPLFGTEGKELEGGNPALGWPLPEPLSAPPPPPPRFALPSRGDPAVGARVRAAAAAGGAARTSGRAPCPATRALSRVEKPRARAPRPPLPAAFPLRLFDDFLPEKKKLIFLPGRSEAINRLLYIVMFSYSSRLPLPSTDSL